MEIPSNLRENTSAFLAAVAAVASLAGLALTLLCGALLFFAIQQAGGAILPQVDSGMAAIENAQAFLSPAEQTMNYTSNGMLSASVALASYSNASTQMGASLGAIAATPPFSLDPRFASSAAKMGEAGVSFADASKSLNDSASGIGNSTKAIHDANENLGSAKERLIGAKRDIGSAIGMLGIGVALGTLSLAALFSSVLAVSVSVLLAYYPSLFAKKKSAEPGQ